MKKSSENASLPHGVLLHILATSKNNKLGIWEFKNKILHKIDYHVRTLMPFKQNDQVMTISIA
jgi:hypothetical protein